MKLLSGFAILIMVITVISAQAATGDTQVVRAKLWDQGAKLVVTTDVSSVKAGKISFEVVNDSKAMVHELLVIKVDDYTNTLPYNEKEGMVYEDKVTDFGEVSELEPGQSGNLTVNLAPGKYLLLCNIPGHYKMGMFADLLVTL